MPKNLRFWANVALIAAAHVAIIFGLMRWSSGAKNSDAQGVIWLGGGDGVALPKPNPRALEKESLKNREPEEYRPILASAPSDIQLSTPTPTPARTPQARSTSTPKPSPSPEIKGTPKRKPKPKPTAKPSPTFSPRKLVLAKASPKPSAKPALEEEASTPAESPNEKIETAKIIAKDEPKKSAALQTGSGKGTTMGSGGARAGGSANAGQFAWYGSMLHDRFYSEWVQPTNVATSGAKSSVLVKLRIERDGKISSFEIVRPSGNAELDDSVKALTNRVSRVEPVPDGLGKGDHYDVKINFELNSE